MEYIDALRGLTMFLVVVGHIWTFVVQKESAVTAQFFMTFRMPIFFFISGFVGYKSSASFTLKDFGTSVWKKFSMALIPCFVFFTLYSLCFYPGIATVVKYGVFDREFFRLCLSGKSMINVFGGYWFVPELFIYFLCYYIVLCLCSLCNKAKYASIILFCFAIVHFLMFDFRRISNHINFEYEIVSSNILYMSLGILVRQYFNRIERLLRNEWVNAAAIITWITLFSLNKYNVLAVISVAVKFFVFLLYLLYSVFSITVVTFLLPEDV